MTKYSLNGRPVTQVELQAMSDEESRDVLAEDEDGNKYRPFRYISEGPLAPFGF